MRGYRVVRAFDARRVGHQPAPAKRKVPPSSHGITPRSCMTAMLQAVSESENASKVSNVDFTSRWECSLMTSRTPTICGILNFAGVWTRHTIGSEAGTVLPFAAKDTKLQNPGGSHRPKFKGTGQELTLLMDSLWKHAQPRGTLRLRTNRFYLHPLRQALRRHREGPQRWLRCIAATAYGGLLPGGTRESCRRREEAK